MLACKWEKRVSGILRHDLRRFRKTLPSKPSALFLRAPLRPERPLEHCLRRAGVVSLADLSFATQATAGRRQTGHRSARFISPASLVI